jgi:hypothetical protein
MEQPFEKTHSLVALVGMCQAFNKSFDNLRTVAITLTPYAVSTRYPGDLAEISSEEATEAYQLAKQAIQFIKEQLPIEI